MYSMEKLARGTILTEEQKKRRDKILSECIKRVKKPDVDDLLYEKDCMGRKRPRRGYLVKCELYVDRHKYIQKKRWRHIFKKFKTFAPGTEFSVPGALLNREFVEKHKK